ncbi:MAG TPA: hypothetical protein VMW52_13425 [Phycisphaerae bacterium]|nr:hypothetical protein [Phycisphaerae bacterium]
MSMSSDPDRADSGLPPAADVAAPRPHAVDAVGPFDAETVTALVPIFAQAVATGVMLAADQAPLQTLRQWAKGQLATAAVTLPAIFGEGASHRALAVGALRAALDWGFEARKALEAKRRGDVPPSSAPDGFDRATLPPSQAWLDRQAAELVRYLAVSMGIEGLDPVDPKHLFAAPAETPEIVVSHVDDVGVHEVRSSYLSDPATNRLYQLVIVRESQRVRVYRRGCAQTTKVEVTDGFTLLELELLAQAFNQIVGEFQPLAFLFPKADA